MQELLNHCTSADNQEKRAYRRLSIGMKVQYRTSEMEFHEEGIVRDVSKSGLLIKTQRILPRQSQIYIQATCPDSSKETISIAAVVIREGNGYTDTGPVYGCIIESYTLSTNDG